MTEQETLRELELEAAKATAVLESVYIILTREGYGKTASICFETKLALEKALTRKPAVSIGK